MRLACLEGSLSASPDKHGAQLAGSHTLAGQAGGVAVGLLQLLQGGCNAVQRAVVPVACLFL